MATEAQILANQLNSQKSTGPTSPQGKAVSSRNHTTHGLCAADPVLPTEDRDAFIALVEQYKSEHQVTTAHAEFLAAEMAGARWKLARIARIEVDMYAALASPEKAFIDPQTAAAFARLERYRAGLERTYHRCARELRAEMKIRNEANSRQTAEKKLEKRIERRLEDAPPDSVCKPRLVPLPAGGTNGDCGIAS